MRMAFLSFILVLSFSLNVYPAETLSELSEDTLPVLNEVLRSLEIDRQLSIADSLNLRSKKIENLATPTADTDATTKAYVDDYVSTYVSAHSSTSVFMGGPLSIATTGNVSLNSFGFQPSVVLFFWAPTSAGNAGSSGFGVMTSTNQFSVHTYSADTNWAGGKSATAISASGGSDPFSFDYVSMDSDGFTINVTDAATSTSIYYLAIK